jgi:hypothetical protein
MPTPEARSAYYDAQHLLERLRDIHTREITLLDEFCATADDAESAVLHGQIDELRTEWTDTFRESTDAIARYTFAVEQSRARAADGLN